MFPTGTWNPREDDREQSFHTNHSHEHKDTLMPSNGVDLTEDNNGENDEVFHDR